MPYVSVHVDAEDVLEELSDEELESELRDRRSDQVYCTPRCRQAANLARRGDGALRGQVSRVSLLKNGRVSVVVTFAAIDRQNALQIAPGGLLEVLGP